MSNPRESVNADDWRIKIENIVQATFVLSIGFQKWTFYSRRLNYACICYVPRGGVGLSLGVNIGPEIPEPLASRIPNFSEDNFEILRPFSANSLDGASSGSFSVGAMGGVAGASGEQLLLRSRAGREIVRFHGGSVGVGFGVSVNLGQINLGTLYGPYEKNVQSVRRHLGISNILKAPRGTVR